MIALNLPGISQLQLTQHLVNGESLLCRVTRDKKEAKEKGTHLSHVYWSKLRSEFGVASTLSQLKVQNPQDSVSSALCEALAEAKNTNAAHRSKRHLTSFFGTVASLNQKEVVGIVKYLSEIKPAANEGSAMAMSAAMKAFVRLGLQEKFPEESSGKQCPH